MNNVDHPPVNVSVGFVHRVHVWWPSPSTTQDGTQASQLLTICIAPPVNSTKSIANDQWAANVAVAAEGARSRIVEIIHSGRYPVSMTKNALVLDAWHQVGQETGTSSIAGTSAAC